MATTIATERSAALAFSTITPAVISLSAIS